MKNLYVLFSEEKPISREALRVTRAHQDVVFLQDRIDVKQLEIDLFNNKKAYREGLIFDAQTIIADSDFSRTDRMRAFAMQKGEEARWRKNTKELEKLLEEKKKLETQLKKEQAREEKVTKKVENSGFLGRNVAGTRVKIEEGQIDFGKAQARQFIKKVAKDGSSVKDYETLVQLIMTYPKSIVTIGEDDAKKLNEKEVSVVVYERREKKSNKNLFEDSAFAEDIEEQEKAPKKESENIGTVIKKFETPQTGEINARGFEYLMKMAAAGLIIAKEVGRASQTDNETVVLIDDYIKHMQQVLGIDKSKSKQVVTEHQTDEQKEA